MKSLQEHSACSMALAWMRACTDTVHYDHSLDRAEILSSATSSGSVMRSTACASTLIRNVHAGPPKNIICAGACGVGSSSSASHGAAIGSCDNHLDVIFMSSLQRYCTVQPSSSLFVCRAITVRDLFVDKCRHVANTDTDFAYIRSEASRSLAASSDRSSSNFSTSSAERALIHYLMCNLTSIGDLC